LLEKSGFATMVVIRDMDRAIRFYTKTLGGKLSQRAPGEMKNMWAEVKIGQELFWLVNPPGKREKRSEVAYNTFIVKDIRSSIADLRKRGVRFFKGEKMDENTKVEGPVSSDAFGSTAFFNDSEGNLMMLWQAAEM
jgi:predicted enzyme related to lactoylglutathione lyase